jgi:hypothetical protein
MATRRITRPLRGDGRDGLDYAEFMAGVLSGSVKATKLIETTVPDGADPVRVEQYDDQGNRVRPDLIIPGVPKRRLTKLEFDDPNG